LAILAIPITPPPPPGFHPISPKVTQYTQGSAEGHTLRSLQIPRPGVPGVPGFGALGWKVTQYTQGSAEGRNP